MRIVVLLVAIFFSSSLMAQNDSSIVNSSWKGKMNIPSTIDVVLSFSKDTLKLYRGDEVMEVMTYQQKNDSLFIKKVDGFSPCGENEIWVCKISINKNDLIINTVSDDCGPRSQSIMDNSLFIRYPIKSD